MLISTWRPSYTGRICRGETLQGVSWVSNSSRWISSGEQNRSFAEAFVLASQFLCTKPPLSSSQPHGTSWFARFAWRPSRAKALWVLQEELLRKQPLTVYRQLLQPSLRTRSLPDTMALFSLMTKPMCCVDSFIIFNEIICVTFDLIFSPVSNRVVE